MSDYGDRAHRLADWLRSRGHTVEEKHYPPSVGDDLDRHYVIVTCADGEKVETQYHQRAPFGTDAQGGRSVTYGVTGRTTDAAQQVHAEIVSGRKEVGT